ncbi:MAG: hypothetical protein CI952_1620, partial [Methanohalophilus sp.]
MRVFPFLTFNPFLNFFLYMPGCILL